MSPEQPVNELDTSPEQSTSLNTPNKPRFRRLASKPLKLAASSLKNRTISRKNSSNDFGESSATSSTTVVPELANDEGYASTVKRTRRRRGLRMRHLHNRNGSGLNMTPEQAAMLAKGPRKPLEGEEPVAFVRVRVVKAEGLVAKDRNGTSDPFLSLVVPPSSRQNTGVVKRTLNPTFPSDSNTFDFPLYLSLAGLVGGRGLEGVMWDKDLIKKDYMGEFAIPITEWFSGDIQLWDDKLPLIKRRLLSTRRRHHTSGTVSLQIGYMPPKQFADEKDAVRKIQAVHNTFVDRSTAAGGLAGVLGVPAHEGIGTIKMRRRSPRNSKGGDLNDQDEALLDTVIQHSYESAAGLDRHDHLSSKIEALLKKAHLDRDGGDDGDDDESSSGDDEYVLADDGLSSSDDEEDPEVPEDTLHEPDESAVFDGYDDQKASIPAPLKEPPKTAGLTVPSDQKRPAPARQSSLPGYFGRSPSSQDEDAGTPDISGPSTPGATTPGGTRRRPLFRRQKTQLGTPSKRSTKDFNFDANNGREVLGIVMVEIQGAEDLPRIKNSLRFGFDMDPFVVIAFGHKIFRTRVIRHSLNPTWNEKLLFHVRRHQENFTIGFSVLDWDKVSGNDMVGNCILPLTELMADAPKPDPKTGLYGEEDDGKHPMKEFTIPIVCNKDQPWESKFSPKLTLRAKYEPYDALRQRFWRQYCTQYDADDTGTISYVELTTMLDSLGSTLTKGTLESYFTTFGKDPENDELTVEEVVTCLEREVNKARSEKAKIHKRKDDIITESSSSTPGVSAEPTHEGLDVDGPQGNISSPVDPDELRDHIIHSKPRNEATVNDLNGDSDLPGNQHPVSEGQKTIPALKIERSSISEDPMNMPPSIADSEASSDIITNASSASEIEDSADTEADLDQDEDTGSGDGSSSISHDRERIINIRSCPLCHRRRLGKRSEQDIVTHLAICASSDWSRMDRIVTANYVTSSQAQRKKFTRLVNKFTVGSYSLGANSANILVQDRRTGQLQEEKMAIYVRVGIRVLYKGARSRMEGARARKLLKSQSIKQGIKYDSPSSAVDIPTFIAFHNLDINEIRDPLDSFKTFNQFFYRKLKADARPVEDPEDNHRLVSCADCRMMAFETVDSATSIWIKGREFSVGRLLGPNYADVAHRFEGGALGIFRLAPQDYHRFHSPVKGKIGKMTMIDGEYYTVNPQAIRTRLDVYGENVRKICPIQSEEFGLVMTVWVGAMMVGSILTSVEEGQLVERADELGYFAFGGSTIVCWFEKGMVHWDADLLENGQRAIETLVRMGSGLGRSTKKPASVHEKEKVSVTNGENPDAK